MLTARLPPDEDRRPGGSDARSGIGQEGGGEPLFARLAALAAQLCGAPLAVLAMPDAPDAPGRAVSMGFGPLAPGAALLERLREHARLADGLLEVADARLDPRFADLPEVQAEPPLCFLAALPIRLDAAARPGLLCVLDRAPRGLSGAQRDSLTQLAATAAEALRLQERAARNHAAVELRAALAAQRDTEARFRVLAEAAPLGIFQSDAAGRCVYVNPAWLRIYGTDLQSSLGDGWGATLHPDDAPEVIAHWLRCAEQRLPFEMSFRIRRPSAMGGDERKVLSRARAVEAADGTLSGYVGVVEDVTERLQAERQLRESQLLLDRTGRVAGVGGWSLDLRSMELLWSDQTCRIHDRPPGHRPSLEEALGYYPVDARRTLSAALERGTSLGKPWSLELPLVTAAGREIWVLAQGQADWQDGVPVRLVGAIQDVTAYHRAAVELEHSRVQLRALYESTPALLYSVDQAGRLLNVSDRLLEHLGYPRQRVVGQPMETLLAPESALRLREVYRPQLWRDGYVNDCAMQLVCANGQLRDMLVSAVTEYDSEGRPLRALAVMEDITEDLRRRAELAREQQLRRQIERHVGELDQLLRERSEMLDVLAHEVRQPLNNASAALQSAASSLAGRGEHQVQERLTRAQAVLGQVLAGVDNTLAAASLLAGSSGIARIDTDIDTLIAVCIADLPRDQRDRIVLRRHTATRTAQMDMSLMRLALRNLLSNALKYAPGISPVSLHILDLEDPLALQFEVADAGPGIPTELLPRLFSRGARGHGGTESAHGLGLYIVRRVMDLHGGSAELVRTGPLGTLMRLTLPQAV